jgi:hypothetical protein
MIPIWRTRVSIKSPLANLPTSTLACEYSKAGAIEGLPEIGRRRKKLPLFPKTRSEAAAVVWKCSRKLVERGDTG